MKTIQQELISKNLSVKEAINVAQNCPLWRLHLALRTSSGACHKRRRTRTAENFCL